MRAVLTDIIIRQAKSGTEIWDMACPTLGLRVGAHKRSWVVKRGNGRVSIGSYPAISLQEARRRVSESETAKDQPQTFSALLDDFRRIYLPTIAPSTAKEWDRLLTKHFSTLPPQPTTRDVYKITETLKPSEANHAIVALRRMLNWARQTGRIQNRLELTKPHKEKSRSRVLSLEELRRVWIATEEKTPFNIIVRLLILTGQRRTETSLFDTFPVDDSM